MEHEVLSNVEKNPQFHAQAGGPPEHPHADRSETRVLSSQRMKYSAEVQLIKNKWGDLEQIRKTLQLSQRKVCQLLFVDPSAWTRWTRPDGEAPPHIYRALSWFLLLQEKQPEVTPYAWLQGVARRLALPSADIERIKREVKEEMRTDIYFKLRQWLIFSAVAWFFLAALFLWFKT